MISKYNDFLLEKEFNQIFNFDNSILEDKGEWIGDNTYHWDMKKTSRLKKLLKTMSKKQIKKYFYKLLSKLGDMKNKNKKRILLSASAVFLLFAPFDYYFPNDKVDNDVISSEIPPETLEAIKNLEDLTVTKAPVTKASFLDAQSLVKSVEKGYSDDRKDRGNFVSTPYGKRFIGTNHGISAPVLMDYMSKLPTKEDMINLSYETALDIYKKKYWENQNLGKINNQSVANIIYDGCVNQGINGMRKVLRKAFNSSGIPIRKDENPYDDKFMDFVNEVDSKQLFDNIKKEREKRYKASKTFSKHGRGWLNRLKVFNYSE
jgi:lysozyme family protein